MEYIFSFSGHKNISATHRTTFELTKEFSLSKKGDCIVGVRANFKLSELKKFLSKNKVMIVIKSGELSEKIFAVPNKNFDSDEKFVVRISDFKSNRTFAIRSDKACANFSRKIIESIKKNGGTATIRESS